MLQGRGGMDEKEMAQASSMSEEWELYSHPDPWGKESEKRCSWGLGSGGQEGKSSQLEAGAAFKAQDP